MRKLKCRAWEESTNRMYYDIDYVTMNGGAFAERPLIQPEVMWYTGLYDSIGQEIYEGDILKNIDTDACYEVYWEEAMFKVVSKYSSPRHIGYMYRVEVIGNIYENPELAVKEQ